jgi:hypothetical protein
MGQTGENKKNEIQKNVKKKSIFEILFNNVTASNHKRTLGRMK